MQDSFEQIAEDFSEWYPTPKEEISRHFQDALSGSFDTLRRYGILITVKQQRAAMRRKAIMYNHGRARKISFRRPSPQMSRARLEQIKASVILEETLRAM